MKRKDIKALDDPLFYVPIFGPVLHLIRKVIDEENEEECDLNCESCNYYDEKTDGCLKGD